MDAKGVRVAAVCLTVSKRTVAGRMDGAMLRRVGLLFPVRPTRPRHRLLPSRTSVDPPIRVFWGSLSTVPGMVKCRIDLVRHWGSFLTVAVIL